MKQTIKQIKKRDGKIVYFDSEKITNAVLKAMKSTAVKNPEENAKMVSAHVVGILEQMFSDTTIPTVEQVQDVVEKVLMKTYPDTAKAYIIYRQKHKELRELDATKREVFNHARRLISGYFSGSDWRARENASSGYITFQGANARLAGDLWNSFALHEIYRMKCPEIAEAHEKGELHIHDLDFPVVAYCCGHSLEQLLKRGFGEVPDRVESAPPKHLRSAINQMINYIGTMQGEFAGAQAFSSVDTFLAPFVRADNDSFEEVKQSMQELIFGLNVPSRWGWQAPFSNLTFDLTVPKDLASKKVLAGIGEADIEKRIAKEKKMIEEKYKGFFSGKNLDNYLEERKRKLREMLDSTYGDYQKEMDMINKAYLEVKMAGDESGRIFTFPIDTYNITKDFNWDSEVANLLFEVAGKYGTPYFQNYISSGLDPGAIRAMCCRLNLDQRELMNRPGNMWGPGDSTGSIGVVTINMNRIGYESSNEEEFFRILRQRMDLAKKSLEIKRKTIEVMLEREAVPYTKSYLGHFFNHFSTIGLVGMHECLVNFMKKGIETPEGKAFAKKVLAFMRETIKEYQKETGNLYNLEATPAESTSYRLAMADKKLYPNIFTSGDDVPFLTNSTQLPVYLDIDLFSALKHQEELQVMYNGGTIFHTFIGERISGEQAKMLVKKIAENTKLPYFSITPVFSICRTHGYIPRREETCPKCGKETEIYDRIVGYYRPVKNWNDGKKAEEKLRKRFKI